MENSCIEIRPTKFQMEMLGIMHRVIKSVSFNILMIIIGFVIGFASVALTVHYYAVTNTNYEFVAKIDAALKDMDRLDDEYEEKQDRVYQLLNEFKKKISYDAFVEKDLFRCNSITNKHSALLETNNV